MIHAIDVVWDRSPCDGTKLLLVLAIADHVNSDWTCWPAIPTLARKIRHQPRSTQYALVSLEKEGAIEVYPNAGPGGCNLYHLIEPSGHVTHEEDGSRRIVPTEDAMKRMRMLRAKFGPARTDAPGGAKATAPGGAKATAPGGAKATAPGGVQQLLHTNRHMEPSIEPSSLLREPQAATREGATAKQSKADPEREALTEALAKHPQYFGKPRSSSEWALWNKRLTSLLSGGLAPTDVPRAVNAWKRKYPNAQLTINALDLHLGELLPAPVSAPPTPAPEPETQLPTPQQEETPRHVELHTPRFPLAEDNGPAPQETIDWTERHRLASERARAALAAANARAAAAPVVSARKGLLTAARTSREVS